MHTGSLYFIINSKPSSYEAPPNLSITKGQKNQKARKSAGRAARLGSNTAKGSKLEGDDFQVPMWGMGKITSPK